MAKDAKNLIVGLDIGTSKAVALVAELREDGSLEILGMGSHESKGLKKGVVVNIEATVNAISRALEEAELMADCRIASAYVGIAGSHIKSFNSTGMVAIKDRDLHHWPGNVRELEHVLEHAFVLVQDETITPNELPRDFLRSVRCETGSTAGSRAAALTDLQDALRRANHNKTKAARLLGISRRTLYRRLERLQEQRIG